MSEIKITWMALQSDREKMIFLDGFWAGVDAGKQMQEEVRKLARELERTQKEIQPTHSKGEEGRDVS